MPRAAAAAAVLKNADDDLDELYNSEDDEDYAPEAGGVDEHDDDGLHKRKQCKQKAKPVAKRGRGGRVGGIMLDDEDEDNAEDTTDKAAEAAATGPSAEEIASAEQAEKERLDALFAAELGMPVKKVAKASAGKAKPIKKKKKSGPMAFKMPGCAATRTVTPTTKSTSQEETKVQVTKTFDFAGESVTVTKEVAANSKEAQKFKEEEAKAQAPKTALDGVLSLMKKKAAMSTVTKTKLDWDEFKEEKGIAEDLAVQNKDGFLEKVAFLQQVDARAHENELRLKDLERAKKNSR
eukprot:m.9547 g.9547  ORF g.9547 m.9547 type:complete len:293 (+) comp2649_c0_seq1:47-925(+)